MSNKAKIKNELNTLREFYIAKSEIIENKQKDYMQNIQLINNGQLIPLKYDFIANSKDNYLNIVNRTKYLQNLIQKEDEEYTGFFITLTLGSKYHKYITNSKKAKDGYAHYNKNFDSDLTINDGYQELNTIFRKLQKDLYCVSSKKKTTLKFIKVLEFHKSMQVHLHGIVFVTKSLVSAFKAHIVNVFGNTKLERINNDKTNKTIYVKNENIGRSEVEEIKDITRVVPYLLKYIKKSLNPKKDENFHLLNGWKKLNKIRIFTMTNVSMPRFVFKKMYANIGKHINKEQLDYNMLEEIEKISDINIDYFTDKTKKPTRSKSFGTANVRFKASVEIDIEEKASFSHLLEDNTTTSAKVYDYILGNVEDFKAEQEIYNEIIKSNSENSTDVSDLIKDFYKNEESKLFNCELILVYKIREFKIIDTHTNKTIYNKSDFKYINKNNIATSKNILEYLDVGTHNS